MYLTQRHPLTLQTPPQKLASEGLKVGVSSLASGMLLYLANSFASLPAIALKLLPGAASAVTYTSAFEILSPILGHEAERQALRLATLLDISEEDAQKLLNQEVVYSSVCTLSSGEALSYGYISRELNKDKDQFSKAEIVQAFPENVSGWARPWVIKETAFAIVRVGVSTGVAVAAEHFLPSMTADPNTDRAINGAIGLAAANTVEAGLRGALAWYQARKVIIEEAPQARSSGDYTALGGSLNGRNGRDGIFSRGYGGVDALLTPESP